MRLLKRLNPAKLRREESGAAAIQFVLIFPFVMMLFAFAGDLGLIMMRKVMLERAVDVEARSLRLGLSAKDDYKGMRNAICHRAKILQECDTRLKIQLTAMEPDAWSSPGKTPDCESLKEVTLSGPVEYDNPTANQLVVMRACVVVEPFMPGWGLGQSLLSDGEGGKNRFYQISAATTFVQEP